MGIVLTDSTTIELFSLHVGPIEDGVQEVGRTEIGEFVALPAEGVVLLRLLDAGLPIHDVRRQFTDRYDAQPDLEGFVEELATLGYVKAVDGRPLPTPHPLGVPDRVGGWRLFANLPPQRVAWLLAAPLRVAYATIWLAVPVALILRPDLIPRYEDALPYSSVLVNTAVMFAVGWSLVFLHEVAHVLATRARGCASSLSLGRRLYFLVAQTDMSGVRAIPRSQRYAPYLAGMTFDLVVLFGCLALKLADVGGGLPHVVAFMAMTQFLFQFAIFLRTDVYYVLANWLRLGNLNQDARFVLINLGRRLLGKPPSRDLDAVPERERRIVNWYTPAYAAGVIVAGANLGFLVLPIIATLVWQAIEGVVRTRDTVAAWDGGVFIAIAAFNLGIPLVILFKELRARRVAARATSTAETRAGG